MRAFYLGCDPGSKGYCCIYDTDSGLYKHFPIFEGKRLNTLLIEYLRQIADTNVIAAVEAVHALPRQGVTSTFTFGTNFGMLLGMLETLGIPYSTVSPGRWQKFIWEGVDKADNPKATSLNAARRLLPNVDFRKSVRARVPDDNIVDSYLINLYAQRKQL